MGVFDCSIYVSNVHCIENLLNLALYARLM
jgi:hypothetical protein